MNMAFAYFLISQKHSTGALFTLFAKISSFSQSLLTPEFHWILGPTDSTKSLHTNICGFRFSTRAHDRSSGLCVDLQEQREREELTKRLGWLKLVAMSRSGACPEVLRTLYLSLIRSKIEFGILLKAESRYMKML